jgi:SAM-dependent methyltransferase
MNLYTTYAKQFSDSRQAPWKGWFNLISKFKIQNSKLSILDLGCGNGRFLKFLMDQHIQVEKYVGLDNSSELLEIAQNQFNLPNIEFINLDLEDNWIKDIKNDSFDLITVFGVVHHLHTFEQRRAILEESTKLLSINGILCVTYWQFLEIERYKDKIIWDKSQQELNNYTMYFGDEKAERFCHFTSIDEIEKLEEGLQLDIIDTYKSDGKENDQNIYRVYKRK